MTIHSEHPFLPDPEHREPARRLRSMLPAPVTIWTSAAGTRRDGWTISSMLVANGEPAQLVALIDDSADWWELFRETRSAVVNVLGPGQGLISDVFARMAPSPGGPFRTGTWTGTPHGPRLDGAAAWVDVTLSDDDPVAVGWGVLIRAVANRIEIADGVRALEYRSGRYLS